jgi:predicted acyl esterase
MYGQVKKRDILILPAVKIAVRDGVKLNATVYKPRFHKGPLPVIFSSTPYISDRYHEIGTYFAQRNYVYVNIDVRGRGSSEGVFEPMANEAKDGHDVVEWLAKQSFSNGKVAMWGGSYGGFNQWATAKELPPHLKTIVPAAASMPGIDYPMIYNIGSPYFSQWLVLNSANSGNDNLFDDRQYWTSKFDEWYYSGLPFATLDSLVGYPNKSWKTYMAHPSFDTFYKRMIPNVAQYRRMNLPVLTITGAYDSDQPGALTYYAEFMRHALPAARKRHWLIIGPWDHAGTRKPTKIQGGVSMGDSSLLDLNDLHWQWYNYTMKDSLKPTFLRDKVMYYVAGIDRWKSAPTLEAIGSEKLPFYLNSFHGKGGPKHDSASLQTEPAQNNKPAIYSYNPLDKDKLESIVYASVPFAEQIEIAGFFELHLYVETNVKDIDIKAEISEVKPDGTQIPLSSHTMRTRYRESLEKEKLLTPGEIHHLRFNRFTFISRMIAKGSRLSVSLYTPNSNSDQINYCSGGPVAYESAKDAHTATVKVYNNTDHQSVLYVPVTK